MKQFIKKFFFIIIIILSLIIFHSCKKENSKEIVIEEIKPGQQIKQKININGKEIRFLLFIPDKYFSETDKKWPTIIFYHGAYENGTNIELVRTNGIPKIVDKRKDFPFIVISPQYELDANYALINEVSILTYNKFIDFLINKYKIDEKRLYLTGLSYGGYMTWKKAMEHSDKFAAIAPVCGFSSYENFNNPKIPDNIINIKNMPVWVFHGANDTEVSIKHADIMVDELKKLGADINYTVFQNSGHDIWGEVYEKDDALYD